MVLRLKIELRLGWNDDALQSARDLLLWRRGTDVLSQKSSGGVQLAPAGGGSSGYDTSTTRRAASSDRIGRRVTSTLAFRDDMQSVKCVQYIR